MNVLEESMHSRSANNAVKGCQGMTCWVLAVQSKRLWEQNALATEASPQYHGHVQVCTVLPIKNDWKCYGQLAASHFPQGEHVSTPLLWLHRFKATYDDLDLTGHIIKDSKVHLIKGWMEHLEEMGMWIWLLNNKMEDTWDPSKSWCEHSHIMCEN
jgi:hypothetical protein